MGRLDLNHEPNEKEERGNNPESLCTGALYDGPVTLWNTQKHR